LSRREDYPEETFVKLWLGRVEKSKEKFDKDFQRMRKNTELAFGLQWDGQEGLHGDAYVNNIILRVVNQKVASLYARDPKASVERVERMDFEVWDGTQESIEAAMMTVMQMQSMGLPPNPEDMMLLNDYETGKQYQKLVDKVAATLHVVYDWQLAQQQPTFKALMKRLVRRTTTCGVGYLRPHFVTDGGAAVGADSAYGSEELMSQELHQTTLDAVEDPDATKNEYRKQQVTALARSLADMTPEEQEVVSELLVLDCLDSTSVLPDPKCTCVKTFEGAQWLAIAYKQLTLLDINLLFKLRLTHEDLTGKESAIDWAASQTEQADQLLAEEAQTYCVYEILDRRTQSHFYITPGFCGFLKAPEPVPLEVPGFWPLLTLTFNDVEILDDTKASIFPPSDVDLIYHPQQERNRMRNELREHRKANAPGQMAPSGALSTEDKDRLESRESNEVVEVTVPPGTDMSKVIQPIPGVMIDSALYDTGSTEQDVLMATGMQEANLGPAKPNVTATVGSIAEQSRQTQLSSNIDDVDDFLTNFAKMTIHVLMLNHSVEMVKFIAGRGAVFPETDRELFLNALSIQVAAASSGRPNQMQDVANYERLAPFLIQAGASPKFMVREGARRLGDRINLKDAFPLVPPSAVPISKPTVGAQPSALPTPV
jgi:hypothetical protein